MALENIEYGSLASSETMNKNFMYLDDKIANTAESIMTSISSILSNIATINNRLNDISENMTDSVSNLTSKLDEYKSKTKILVNKACLVPDWLNCTEIVLSADKNHIISSNGYVLMLPKNSYENTLSVNNSIIDFRIKGSYYSYGNVMFIPVFEGDELSTKVDIEKLYFLPSKEVVLEDF